MPKLEAQLLTLLTQLAALQTTVADLTPRVAALEARPAPTLSTSAFVGTLLDTPDATTFRQRLELRDLPDGVVDSLLQSAGAGQPPHWRSLQDIAAQLPAVPWSGTP